MIGARSGTHRRTKQVALPDKSVQILLQHTCFRGSCISDKLAMDGKGTDRKEKAHLCKGGDVEYMSGRA